MPLSLPSMVQDTSPWVAFSADKMVDTWAPTVIGLVVDGTASDDEHAPRDGLTTTIPINHRAFTPHQPLAEILVNASWHRFVSRDPQRRDQVGICVP
jgi:hypothetical protein